MSKETVFQFGSRGALRRAETWDSKQRQAGWQKRYEKKRALDRAKELKPPRKQASLAKGLTAYRKQRNLSRTAFAKELGIKRRTLYNYENGTFPVPGNIIEKIISRGDVELSDIFGLPPEAPHIFRRFDDARLALSLFAACLEEYRTGSIDQIATEVVLKTGEWPFAVRRTEHSIKRVARRIAEELGEREMAAELDKEVSDPNYRSQLLEGQTEVALAENMELQFQFLQQAYASGNEELFDQAVARVEAARRMKSNGIMDMIKENSGLE